MASPGVVRIGTSGYQYDHWVGPFYPKGLPKRSWFAYYAEQFRTVEINNTFYSLPKPATFARWRDAAPAGFLFALKFSRYGSHLKRLKDPEATINHFLDAACSLGDTLGPVLIQLPPRWHADPDRLNAFLATAPREIRWAMEFRDDTWLCDEVFAVLREHGAALCVHDMLPGHPWITTADWVYMRFHGDRYAGSYSDATLADAAAWLAEQRRAGRDGFAFFNNDEAGKAVTDAMRLTALLKENIH